MSTKRAGLCACMMGLCLSGMPAWIAAEVQAGNSEIDSTSTAVEETIEKEVLDELPTGRSYFDAMAMLPGVAGGGAAGEDTGESQFHIHGADDSDNIYLVDGFETTDNAGGTFGMNLPYEAIEEVEVMTGGFDAEYGRATGGIVNVITKSGGNEFHGSIPIYYTNEDLNRHQESDRTNYPTGVEDRYRLDAGASLGGPIVRDQAWFFATYNRITDRESDYSPYREGRITLTDTFESWLAKLTWQVSADNKIVATYAEDPATMEYYGSSDKQELEQGGRLLGLQWTSIFTPNLFLEAKVATHDLDLNMGPAEGDSSNDYIENYHYGEGYSVSGTNLSTHRYERPRNQASAVLSYYKGGPAGEHSFKFGAEYQDFEYREASVYPEHYRIHLPNGEDQWYHTEDLDIANTGNILTAFVQDDWHLNDTLTFNLGLRWERQEQENDVGERVYRLDNLLAPRAGVAWDVLGDGRSRLFAHYGRYFDAVGTYLGQAMNRQASWTRYYEGDYDTGEWDEIDFLPPPENLTQVDPDLDPSFKDQVVAGYEFEFATDFTGGVTAIYNWQDNLIEDVMGNEDDVRAGLTYDYWYYITNVKEAERKYRGLEFKLRKRLSSNYQFLVAYTLSESKGSVANDGQIEGLNVYGDIAETKYNRYGYLPWDDRHYLKLNGSYHLPWGIIAGASFGWRSGRPYNRVGYVGDYGEDSYYLSFYGNKYYVDPRGSHRMGHVWWLDLRLIKDFEIGDHTLSVIVDAINVTNNQFVLQRRENYDPYYRDVPEDPNWGRSMEWMEAGRFELGVKYTF